MTKEQLLIGARINLKDKLSETRAELAELKLAISKLPSRNSACLAGEFYDAIELVKALAQAKELKK